MPLGRTILMFEVTLRSSCEFIVIASQPLQGVNEGLKSIGIVFVAVHTANAQQVQELQ